MYSPLDGQSTFHSQRRRRVFWLVIVALAVFLLISTLFQHTHTLTSILYGENATGSRFMSPMRRHVAVASHFSQHFDVHLAAAHTFREVLGDKGDVRVFASTPLRFGFQDVVDSLNLYDREIEHPDDFMDAVKSNSLYATEPGKMIDLVVFGTCEIDMGRWSDELLVVWDARPMDQKFKIVCIVHNFRDKNWQKHITPWASRGALRLLPIGYHVGRAFRNHFLELADSPEPELYTALYEYIDADVHAPVLNLPEYGQRQAPAMLSRAVIQGNFQLDRRDYTHIFRDLLDVLKDNSEAWGYRPLGYDRDVYEPLPSSENEPFQLHLIGDGHLDIPKALSKVIYTHNGLNYTDFYAFMQSMDIVIPAFVNMDYYDFQASSTVAMAVQCNVPILASRRMRSSYGYIDDDRVTIVRPQALREIYAIGALRDAAQSRSPDAIEAVNAYELENYKSDVKEMLRGGCRRSARGFAEFKEELWAKNRAAVSRVLADLPGEI